MFDNYTLKARFYPVIILFFPIIITGVFYSFQFESLVHLFTSLGLVGALTYLFSQLGRDQGKKKEGALWESWGGSPTVQILRLRDTHIDSHTKLRYHKKMQQLCVVPVIPDITMETTNSNNADEVYKAWTKYLISQTRDSSKYPLLLKDNTSYGFRRNLWGLKPYGLFITCIIAVCNFLFWANQTKSWNPLSFPNAFLYSTLTLFLILIFWISIVTRNWIKIPAFAYAERLCEAIESL